MRLAHEAVKGSKERSGFNLTIPISLPYRFDSTAVVRYILKGILLLMVGVIAPGILYSLVISRTLAVAIQLLIVGVLLFLFGIFVCRNLTGATGVIALDSVVLEPVRLYGIRLLGPVGRVPIGEFISVRFECVWGPLGRSDLPHWHGRLYLVRRTPEPPILIVRTELNEGLRIGEDLARLLGLSFEQNHVRW